MGRRSVASLSLNFVEGNEERRNDEEAEVRKGNEEEVEGSGWRRYQRSDEGEVNRESARRTPIATLIVPQSSR